MSISVKLQEVWYTAADFYILTKVLNKCTPNSELKSGHDQTKFLKVAGVVYELRVNYSYKLKILILKLQYLDGWYNLNIMDVDQTIQNVV